MATTLFATSVFAWGGGSGVCSDFELGQGLLSCKLYCGTGHFATKLNCDDQQGGGDASKFCVEIKAIFEKRSGGDTLPCDEPPPVACPCSPEWDNDLALISEQENACVDVQPDGVTMEAPVGLTFVFAAAEFGEEIETCSWDATPLNGTAGSESLTSQAQADACAEQIEAFELQSCL